MNSRESNFKLKQFKTIYNYVYQMAESLLPSIERIPNWKQMIENLEFNGPLRMFNDMAIVFTIHCNIWKRKKVSPLELVLNIKDFYFH